MSSSDFNRILDDIEQYDEDDYVTIESGVPASESEIAAIAQQFAFALPDEYREFLKTFGTLNIGGIEFIGSSESNYLDVLAERAQLANEHDFPNDLIPLQNEDGDSYVCMRVNGALIRWFPGDGTQIQLDESLAAYLLRLCDELIEDEGEEAGTDA